MVATGTGAGLLQWLMLYKRVETLRRLIAFVNRMGERIRYAAVPLDELLHELSLSPEFLGWDFLEMLAGRPAEENGREQWMGMIGQHRREWGLTDEDEGLICAFLGALGLGDVDGEWQFCHEYSQLLSKQLLQAEDALKGKGKAYLTLGICVGSVTALLLW